MNLAELFVEISAKTGGFTTGMNLVQARLGGMTKTFGAVGTAVGTFVGNIGSRLASIAIPALGDVFGGTAIDMERQLGGLAKATDLAGPKLEQMKQGIFGLSTSLSGVRLDDLIAIATTGAKMGISTDGLLQFTEGIAKASTAVDDMSALELAESVGKINVVFKLGEGGALQLSSAFDKLADSGVASFSGIANVTQRISGAAAAAGITAQEAGALAAALLDTGTHAELGATAITRLIASLNNTEAQADFGKVLGISAEEFAAKVKGSPIAAIQEFLKALNQLPAGDQMKALKGIGFEGVQGAGEIQKLASQTVSLAKYVGFANSEFRTLDQVNKSYNQTAGQTGSLLTQQQNRFQIMSDTIGRVLLPTINLLGGAFGGLAGWIEGAVAGNAGQIGAFIDGLVAAFATAAGRIGAFVADIVAPFAPAAARIGAFVAGLIAAFATVGPALGSVFANLQVGLGGLAERLATTLGVILDGLPAIPVALAAALGPEATAVVAQFATDFVFHFNDMTTQAAILIRNLPLAFDVMSLEIAKHLVGMGAMFQHWGESAGAVFAFVRDTGVAVFTYLGELIGGIFERVLASIRNSFALVETAAQNILTANVGDVFKGEFDLFKDFDVGKARAESSLANMKLPDFQLPTLKMPEVDRSAQKIIEEQIVDKWAAIARSETRRGDAATAALEAARPLEDAALDAARLKKGGGPAFAPALDDATRQDLLHRNSLLGKLGVAPLGAGVVAAIERSKLSPKQRARQDRAAALAAKARAAAARNAKKKAGANALVGLSPAERRRKQAEAARLARAAALRKKFDDTFKPGSGADEAEQVQILKELLKVNTSSDAQLKKGLIARAS